MAACPAGQVGVAHPGGDGADAGERVVPCGEGRALGAREGLGRRRGTGALKGGRRGPQRGQMAVAVEAPEQGIDLVGPDR